MGSPCLGYSSVTVRFLTAEPVLPSQEFQVG
jgi:hypothetical protein